jgi:hypothetical protein
MSQTIMRRPMKCNPIGLANPLANVTVLPSDPTRRIRPLRGDALSRCAGSALTRLLSVSGRKSYLIFRAVVWIRSIQNTSLGV